MTATVISSDSARHQNDYQARVYPYIQHLGAWL